jgi:etoposide-induced 2.4 mRNA
MRPSNFLLLSSYKLWISGYTLPVGTVKHILVVAFSNTHEFSSSCPGAGAFWDIRHVLDQFKVCVTYVLDALEKSALIDFTIVNKFWVQLDAIALFQFVLTAAGTQAEQVIDGLKPAHEGKLQRIPVFFVAKRLT